MFKLGHLFAWFVLVVGAQDWTGAERIVAVGDVHGDYQQFQAILRMAGVIDGKNRWVGGKAHLVQAGDVLDRGAESRKVMDLLMDLEKQARRSGGRVHALIGNHEAMNIYGDLRYVSAAEYEAFRTGESEQLRAQYYQSFLEQDAAAARAAKRDPDGHRRKWMASYPPGWLEHRQAFSPKGKYGKWITEHNAIVKIGGAIFLHGGVSPKYATREFDEINKLIREGLRAAVPPDENSPIRDPDGPLWYRGLVQGSESELDAHVADVLTRNQAQFLVIGHTPTKGAVVPRFGGKVLAIDVGLSAAYNSRRACLVLEEGKPFLLLDDRRIPIPLGQGEAVDNYLREALR